MSTFEYPYKHHPDLQTLTISFQVPSRGPCILAATIQPDLDPIAYGQGLLGIWPNPKTVTSFPIMQATIAVPSFAADADRNLASKGYATLYGWIQMTHASEDGTDSNGSRIWVMDPYPPFADLNTPFVIWGSHPTTVDCPGRDTELLREYDWSARTWLGYSPDAAMSRTVVPVLGFEWGFWIDGGRVFVKELKRLDVKVWEEHLGLLRRKYDGWVFESSSFSDGK